MAFQSTPLAHVLTPGDHFSPRTGSAVPTVVDGLAQGSGPLSAPSVVVVARGTYEDHYRSSAVLEYKPIVRHLPLSRYVDVAMGRLGLRRLDSRRTWSAAVRMQAEWPPSVILAHNGPQLIPSIDVSRHSAVLYAHNELFQTYSSREATRTVDHAAFIACVSNFLAERTTKKFPSRFSRRVHVVPNGVDCSSFYPRSDLERNSRLNVVFIGRTVPAKGPDILLEAAVRLDRLDMTIHIVGSQGFDPEAPLSPYEERLRVIAGPISDRVTFSPTMARHQVPNLIRNADVLVVPSKWPEPFGLTVLEGMASGVPVIASSIGGIPEAMGNAGIQVPANDPVALAEALDALAHDEQARQGLGSQCRLYAQAHDWHRSRRQLDELIAEFC